MCLFVGYPKETRGGFFYSPDDNKVFVSTNATFLEGDYMREFKPRSKMLLEELLTGSTSTPSSTKVDKYIAPSTSDSQMLPSQNDLPPRHSGRVVRQPDRYLGIGELQVVASSDGIDDPLTYSSAMDDSDKEEWLKAMNLEMESMYSNSVWELVDQPDGVKPIGCKWIYKRKRGSDEKVQTFKSRLVNNGYTQEE